MLVTVSSADLVRGRLIAYSKLISILLVLPFAIAFFDPVSMTDLAFVLVRRCLLPCGAAAVQVFIFGRMVVRSLLWPLPGLSLYLLRLCLAQSDEISSGFEGFVFVLPQFLCSLILCFLMEAWRWRASKSAICVQPINLTPTSTSVPNQTIGNSSHLGWNSVVPSYISSEVDGSAASSQHVLQLGEGHGAGQSEDEEAMKAEQSTVAGVVHVYVRNTAGEIILDFKAEELTVEDLRCKISFLRGVCPKQVDLYLDFWETPLLDSETLAEVDADVCTSSVEPLSKSITMVVNNEEHARGPFALGQDQSWGYWETMSNSSGPLADFDGKWKRQNQHVGPGCWDELEITGTQGLNAFRQRFDFHVKHGRVYTVDMLDLRNYDRRWEMRDEHLCAINRAGLVFATYLRIASAHAI